MYCLAKGCSPFETQGWLPGTSFFARKPTRVRDVPEQSLNLLQASGGIVRWLGRVGGRSEKNFPDPYSSGAREDQVPELFSSRQWIRRSAPVPVIASHTNDVPMHSWAGVQWLA